MAVVAPARFDGLQSVDMASTGLLEARTPGGGGAWTACPIPTGDYYVSRYNGEAVVQLVEAFDVAVSAVCAFLSTINTATGYATLVNANAGATLDIRFTGHTGPGVVDVGVMLGLIDINAAASPVIGPIAALGTFAGPYQHYYGWFPDQCTSEADGRIDREGTLTADAEIGRASCRERV